MKTTMNVGINITHLNPLSIVKLVENYRGRYYTRVANSVYKIIVLKDVTYEEFVLLVDELTREIKGIMITYKFGENKTANLPGEDVYINERN